MATLARIFFVSLGLDSFTANMSFFITLGVAAIIYFSIQAILQGVMLPFIGKLLIKIPYFRKQQAEPTHIEEKPKPKSNESSHIDFEEIRRKQQMLDEKREMEHVSLALDYTKQMFASYAKDSQIDILCNNIVLYASASLVENLPSVRISEQLTTLDIYHFGWNIWNHFRVNKQDDMASFLKTVFSQTLRDVEKETIKKHLKDDERKGIIKISDNIAEVFR
jgi:hypothetical protein